MTTIAELIALFYKERNNQNGVPNFFGISVSVTASGDSDRPILSRSLENFANAHLVKTGSAFQYFSIIVILKNCFDQKPANRRRMSDDVTEFFQPEPTEKEMSKLLTQFTLNFLLRGNTRYTTQYSNSVASKDFLISF